MNPVGNILGVQTTFRCFNCDKKTTGEKYYWYHGDQDDLVCEECAKKLKHTDTIYRGMNVFKSNT
jgi:NAD-dependent SIR2 family protein deacetylase